MTRLLAAARVVSTSARIIVGCGMLAVVLATAPTGMADVAPHASSGSESLTINDVRHDMALQALAQRVERLEKTTEAAHWETMTADLANLKESVKSAYTMLWTLALGVAVNLLSGLPSLLIAKWKSK